MNENTPSQDECISDGSADTDTDYYGSWDYLSDTILLYIFQYFSPRELLDVGLTCKNWLRVSYDDFLWRDLVYSQFKIDRSINILPGKHYWLQEYKRLTYHTPVVQTEVLENHTDQVLHVSFAHNGKYFATCSKDGSILVWYSKYPAEIKYSKDMTEFGWKYTQFCQFNESDTLLLVSGVLLGTLHSTTGEIAVFSMEGGFNLQCRVVNKPYDIFGTWYSDQYLLSGDTYWLAQLVTSSVLWLNKASQETSSEHVPVVSQLYRFYNNNASAVRAVMVANCLFSQKEQTQAGGEQNEKTTYQPSTLRHVSGNPFSHKDMKHSSKLSLNDVPVGKDEAQYSLSDSTFFPGKNFGEGLEYESPIYYNEEYRKVETESHHTFYSNLDDSKSEEDPSLSDDAIHDELDSSEFFLESDCSETEDISETNREKLLIFTTGSKTYTPHQIGVKIIKPFTFPKRIDPGPSLAERIAEKERRNSEARLRPEPNQIDLESIAEKFDKVDHLIDLHGHIIGMSLSPDHRYLYVNNRPWPQECVIENPLNPPPIAQEIDIHVIDLVTLKEVGTMLRAHKAYTPNNECFFIFLNVCNEYVASGAEDRHGYLWDRHYGVCLAKYPHTDVVNSVAFNPKDSEMLVSTSDDNTIKIWRSRHRVKQLKIKDGDNLPRGIEIRLKNKN